MGKAHLQGLPASMRATYFLILCANVVNGATFLRGVSRRLDASKSLRGLSLRQAHNVTTGGSVQARIARNATNLVHDQKLELKSHGPTTFRSFYDSISTGRGIWKWVNALDAYDRHFQAWRGQPVKLGEVGVQSGGSILMWQGVLGSQIQIYGFDINPGCAEFAAPGVEIRIGDQADPSMWKSFFSTVTPALDILIDDGGHQSHQMMTTMTEVFPHITPGGFLVIEDIHGQHYMQSFFAPAAQYIGQSAQSGLVDSVHVYPFLLIVQKAGQNPTLPPANLQFASGETSVDSFESLWAAIPLHAGGTIVLRNPGWGPFLTGAGLTNFFAVFIHMHGSAFVDNPAGCATTAASSCTNSVQNSAAQSAISGIHVYNDRLVVEVPASPPVIQAVRKGTEWRAYGL